MRPFARTLVAASLLAAAAPSLAQLNPYVRGTLSGANDLRGGYVAAGAALRGTGGNGTITIAGIPFGSTVKEAILYWTILGDDPMPAGADVIKIDGETFNGTLLGSTASPCQSMARAYVFRADATYWISGDGAYEVSGALDSGDTGTSPVAEGASLVVIYSNPAIAIHDIVVADGAVLASSPNELVTTTITGFNASTPITGASVSFIVADGESDLTDSTYVNGLIIGQGALNGSDAPAEVEWWDTDTFDATAVLSGGATSVTPGLQQGSDCFVWAATPFAIVSPAPDADILTANLTPTVVAGTNFRMRVTATNNSGANVPVTASIDVFKQSGQFLGTMMSGKVATVPASASETRVFRARIPATLPPSFRGIPIYVKTTLLARPGGELIDDDYVIFYVQ